MLPPMANQCGQKKRGYLLSTNGVIGAIKKPAGLGSASRLGVSQAWGHKTWGQVFHYHIFNTWGQVFYYHISPDFHSLLLYHFALTAWEPLK